jgi:hypothetical protein
MYELLTCKKVSAIRDPYGGTCAIPMIDTESAPTHRSMCNMLVERIKQEFICVPYIAWGVLVYECYSKYTTGATRLLFFVNREGYIQTGGGRVFSTLSAAATGLIYGTSANPAHCSILGVKLARSKIYIGDSAHLCFRFTYYETQVVCLKSPYFDDVLILYFGRYSTAFSTNGIDFEDTIRRACIGARSIPKALGEYKPSHQICSTYFWLTPKWLEDSIISSDYKNRQWSFQI